MNYRTLLLGVLVWTLIAIRSAVAEDPNIIDCNTIETYLPKIIVLAKVVNVKEEPKGWLKATLEITHVFAGPENILGERFFVSSTKSGQGGTGNIFPPLENDEVGIWCLARTDTGFAVVWSPWFGIGIPARKGISKRYDQAKAWAEAVGAVCKADPDKRLEMLKEYTLSTTPEVSTWAIRIIGTRKERSEFLENLLTNKRLCIPGQTAIDEVLSRSDAKGKKWQKSKKRLDMLQKWVSGEISEYDADRVHRRLDVCAQGRKLDTKTLLGLMDLFVSNEKISLNVRRDSLWTVGWICKRTDDDELAFEFVIEQIKEAKDQEIREQASRSLRNFVPLDKDQFAIVQNLKESVKEEKLIDILEKVLNRSKSQKEK